MRSICPPRVPSKAAKREWVTSTTNHQKSPAMVQGFSFCCLSHAAVMTICWHPSPLSIGWLTWFLKSYDLTQCHQWASAQASRADACSCMSAIASSKAFALAAQPKVGQSSKDNLVNLNKTTASRKTDLLRVEASLAESHEPSRLWAMKRTVDVARQHLENSELGKILGACSKVK